ncbi:MAG: class I SAM-dependent methyltransferase [Verrucomicrobia bacterium]|nr:class I SAM-dependent methyltransferase [Verrucomicrobiota bacterium]
MKNLKNLQSTTKIADFKIRPIDFITIGVGCNCLVALQRAGVLNSLVQHKSLTIKEINGFENSSAIYSALMTLRNAKVVKFVKDNFKLTKLGIQLATKYIGLITMIFDGYGSLISNQSQIINKKSLDPELLIRGPIVSNSAVELAKCQFDPILSKEFSKLTFSGTICDLGCGYGHTLSLLCRITGNPGLGFDCQKEVVAGAKKMYKGTNIEIRQMDITQIKDVWEDVVILMQTHVFHDFYSNNECVKLLNSYLKNFPNLKYFFYLDTVAASPDSDEILPGFDYVHGLLGIKTRTYSETIAMFEKSNYVIQKEVKINDMPNTYLWILRPSVIKHVKNPLQN